MFGLGGNSKKKKSSTQTVRRASQPGDLLSQISAEDVLEEKKRKEKADETPITTRIFVMLMRGFLVYDGYSRKHRPLFKLAAFIWGVFISTIYLGGIIALSIVGYSYMRFPALVRQYFEANNMIVDSLKMQDYNFSQIEINGIQDNDRTYQINQMNIRSSFSDFLRKKVKLVSLNDATIQINETEQGLDLGNLLKFLINLNTRSDVSVANASVKTGTLIVQGDGYRFPVQFSMTGQYDNHANIRVPIMIKENDLTLSGVLSIMGNPASLDWQFEILMGSITLPNHHSENISGKMNFKTKNMTLSEIKGDLTLSYEKNTRQIKIDLTRRGDEFEGTTSLAFETKGAKDNSKNIKSELLLTFKGLKVPSFSRQSTDKPIQVKISTLTTENYELSQMETTLEGNLTCHLGSCKYDLKKEAPVRVQHAFFKRATETYTTSKPVQFVFLPQAEFLSFENQQVAVRFGMRDFSFEGYRNAKDAILKVTAESLFLEGYPFDSDDTHGLRLQAGNFDYDSPEVTLLQTDVIVDDLLKTNSKLSLNSASVQLKNSNAVKKPFSLRFQTENKLTKAQATVLDTNIQVNFSGLADFSLPEFKGTVYIPPFQLNTFDNLSDLSGLFLNTLSNVSGDISLYGNVYWRSEKQVTGPLFLALKNVSFERGNMKVVDLNTVISLQSLVPFISQPNQSIFVGKVLGPVPLQNIMASVKFDTQLIRIPSLRGFVAGVPVYMDSTIVPYRTSGMTVYFKNTAVDWSKTQPSFASQDISLEGTGTISFPVEIKDNVFNVRNGEVKLVNTAIRYKGDNKLVRSKILNKGNMYLIRNGNFIVNTKENGIVDTYTHLEGVTEPKGEKVQVKTSDTFRFEDIFELIPVTDIPEEIAQKQDLMIQ